MVYLSTDSYSTPIRLMVWLDQESKARPLDRYVRHRTVTLSSDLYYQTACLFPILFTTDPVRVSVRSTVLLLLVFDVGILTHSFIYSRTLPGRLITEEKRLSDSTSSKL